MELADLQITWMEHDKKLEESININKTIFKNILTEKTERKMNWVRAKAIFNLILPIVLLAVMLIPKLVYRNDFNFIMGGVLFGTVFVMSYYWAVQYFIKVLRIDLKNKITTTKKNLIILEKYKFKITKLGYLFIPFAIIGMFMMLEIPLFSENSLLPIFLIILTMAVSIYVTFKFSIINTFKRINQEILEIEKLEIK